jgi:hypothetical protein
MLGGSELRGPGLTPTGSAAISAAPASTFDRAWDDLQALEAALLEAAPASAAQACPDTGEDDPGIWDYHGLDEA